jgi:hypothetical protein
LFQRERSGRSSERSSLQHSQRYVLSLVLRANPEYDCQRNNKLVWDETILIMTGLFDDVWGGKSEIVVDQCVDITLPVRFLWLILYKWPNILTRLR